ncbi:MAG: hypothetical protein FWG73_07185 [Planctomycetaceae bacterium]|nr:hypothetical protein [Planctomycetaceae bacterium]
MHLLLFGILTANSLAFSQTEGDQFLQNSLNILLAMRNVECDIRIETLVDGKVYTAKGHYAEQALPHAMPNAFFRSVYRLDIDFPTSASGTNMAEPNRMTLVSHVSDNGARHQIDRYISIEGNRSASTIDVKRLEERLRSSHRENFFRQVSEVRNLGGLAAMIRQLHRFYEFSAPVQENLSGDETVSVQRLSGTLRSIYHKELLDQFGGLTRQDHYPADFPSDVEVWLGTHNGFPYKIQYLRRPTENSTQKDLLFQETFHNVVLNGPPLSDSRFAPLNLPEGIFNSEDDTDNVIRSLGL